MNRQSRLPLPRVLKMPLRDILRGVATVADITEEVLEPATALLPGPVQTPFRSALAAFEDAGTRAVTPRIDVADIVRAAAFLQGADTSREAMEIFVSVLAYVWERALSRHGDQHLLFSETVAATSLAVRTKDGTKTSYVRAAAILTSLRDANAASRLPGIPMAPSANERIYVDQTMLSACVWLLSERASDIAEEARLLELAFALTQAREDDLLTGIPDEALLAEQMKNLAEHL